jgi:hypothetical protein
MNDDKTELLHPFLKVRTFNTAHVHVMLSSLLTTDQVDSEHMYSLQQARVSLHPCNQLTLLHKAIPVMPQNVSWMQAILETLGTASASFSRRNLRLMFDVLTTLSEAVGRAMTSPDLMSAYMGPLFVRFQAYDLRVKALLNLSCSSWRQSINAHIPTPIKPILCIYPSCNIAEPSLLTGQRLGATDGLLCHLASYVGGSCSALHYGHV